MFAPELLPVRGVETHAIGWPIIDARREMEISDGVSGTFALPGVPTLLDDPRGVSEKYDAWLSWGTAMLRRGVMDIDERLWCDWRRVGTTPPTPGVAEPDGIAVAGDTGTVRCSASAAGNG